MSTLITSFRGEYAFLSNMYSSPIKLGNVTYTCAEAAFQAVKLEDKNMRHIFSGLSGSEAKALGRRVILRPNWENIKIDVMRWIIKEKFQQNPKLKDALLHTCGNDLIEGNTWGDTFWGVCNGRGQNWLGKILMEYRNIEKAKNDWFSEKNYGVTWFDPCSCCFTMDCDSCKALNEDGIAVLKEFNSEKIKGE